MWKVTLQGPRRAQAALRAHRDRGDPRRRVHLGHARAHRDDPADLRRPVRRTSTRAPTRSCAATRCSRATSAPASGRTSRVVARRRSSPAPGVEGGRRQRRRSTTRRSSTRTARPIGNPGQGAPDARLRVGHEPEAQPVPHRPSGTHRREPTTRSSIDKRHAPTRATCTSATRSTVLTGRRRRSSTRSSASRGSAPPTASPARRSSLFTLPQAQTRRRRAPGSSTRSPSSASPASRRTQVAANIRSTLARRRSASTR